MDRWTSQTVEKRLFDNEFAKGSVRSGSNITITKQTCLIRSCLTVAIAKWPRHFLLLRMWQLHQFAIMERALMCRAGLIYLVHLIDCARAWTMIPRSRHILIFSALTPL